MTDVISIETYRPHVLGLDLTVGPKAIEDQMLERKPAYYLQIQRDHPTAGELQIERSILRKWKKEDIGHRGKYGFFWREHLARYMRLLMPGTLITPAFMDELFALELTIFLRRDITNFIGSKSSGKSALLARVAIALVTIDPEYTVCYAAAPFKNVADYTIWSEIDSCFREIQEAHKDVFPDMRSLPSAKTFYFSEKHPKAGKLQLIGLDQVSKFQGSKARSQERGFFILLADEIGVFPSNAFVEIIGNVTANLNFLGMTGCNFKSILGMDGILCDPDGREYQELSLEHDHIWLSGYNSVTLRLDGHLSPNVLNPTKRVIYPFLLTEEKRAVMQHLHDLRGPKYLEQVRSFPNTASGDQFVLTLDQIRAGGGYDKHWNPSDKTVWTRVSFCDPGFGGDPCKVGAFEFGMALVQAHDGSMQRIEIFRPCGPIETIKVQAGITITPEVLAKISKYSKSPIMTKEGRDYSMDLQIAIGFAEFNARMNIPAANAGFDGSMRAGVTKEIVSILGPEVMGYDTNLRPTTMVMDGSGTMAQDKYRNLRSEMFFTLAAIVNSGQLRDADMIQDALGQICRHRVVRAGIKEAIESKDEYKKANQNKSPDAGDVAVGAAHVARRRGFQLAMNKAQAVEMFRPSFDGEVKSIRPRASIARLSR